MFVVVVDGFGGDGGGSIGIAGWMWFSQCSRWNALKTVDGLGESNFIMMVFGIN